MTDFKRRFRATITDLDGETHEYTMRGVTLWAVIQTIQATMTLQGDYYGHIPSETMNIEIVELTA